jgi:DNA-binding transcriptional regulator YdaS (Cro superfamily)
MKPHQALEKATAAVGSRATLARLIGISVQALNQWAEIPAKRVLEVERVTGVSRHELRPDLYPEEARPVEMAEPKRDFRSEDAPGEGLGKVRVQADGSAIVPASVLGKAGFADGDLILIHVAGDGRVELLSRHAGIRRAQEIVRRFVPENVSLVDELLKERRREFEKEEREYSEWTKK